MKFLKIQNVNNFLTYLCGILFLSGIGTMWFQPKFFTLGMILVLLGILFYLFIVKRSFDALMDGGENRFIELYLNKKDENKFNEKEFTALESFYFLVKPISLRLPEELKEYKFQQIVDLENQIIQEKEKALEEI